MLCWLPSLAVLVPTPQGGTSGLQMRIPVAITTSLGGAGAVGAGAVGAGAVGTGTGVGADSGVGYQHLV